MKNLKPLTPVKVHPLIDDPFYFYTALFICKFRKIIKTIELQCTPLSKLDLPFASGIKDFFGPVLLLVPTAVSWYLRPANRKMILVNQ